ncbi:MAG: DUF3617 family protein, partial [Gammaproteobacteria bacterium]
NKSRGMLLGGLLLACVLPAGAVSLEPGKWEMEIKGTNPLTNEPVDQTTIQCVDQASYDPVSLMANVEQCKLTDLKEKDNRVAWTMECDAGTGMPFMTGEGRFESRGRTVAGEMIMKISLGSMSMEQHSHMKGRFLGPRCD